MIQLTGATRVPCRLFGDDLRVLLAFASLGYAVGAVGAGEPLGEQLWLLVVLGALLAVRNERPSSSG
ncbi:MAG: hypothetical protein ABEH80_01555 [Halobaculum sp.]